MISGIRYTSVILPVLTSDAVLRSVPKGSTESASGCVPAYVRYVSIAVALKTLGDYTIPTIGFTFIDLMVLD